MTERQQQFSEWKLENFSSVSTKQNKQMSTIQLKTTHLDKQWLFFTYLTEKKKKKIPSRICATKLPAHNIVFWAMVPQEINCQWVQVDIRLCTT